MAERVAAELCMDDCVPRDLPLILARDWPDVPILDVVLAIATGCDAVEAMFGRHGPSGERAGQAWRMAALLATDLRAMQALGLPAARAADLLAYWRLHDAYFLSERPGA